MHPLSIHMKRYIHSSTPDPAVRSCARTTYIQEHLIPLSFDMHDILTSRNTWSRGPLICKIYLRFQNTRHHSPFIWRDTYTPAHRIPLSVHVQYILTLPKHLTPISVHMFEILTFRYTWSHCPFMRIYLYSGLPDPSVRSYARDTCTSGTPDPAVSSYEDILRFRTTRSLCSFKCTIYLHFQNTWHCCPFICMIYLHFWNIWYHCPFICKIYVYFRNFWNHCAFIWRDTYTSETHELALRSFVKYTYITKHLIHLSVHMKRYLNFRNTWSRCPYIC